jgi:prephenate dehydrogenase
MKKAAIIGFGRFGSLLAGLASKKFELTIIENDFHRAQAAINDGYVVEQFDCVAYQDFIFLAVPISEIEPTLIKLSPFVTEKHVVIDLCSVKVFPVKLMQQYIPKAQIIGSHPMFGPDSAKLGLEGLQVAVCPISSTAENLQFLMDFWEAQGVSVIETTPEQHDKDTVYSQALTYSIAKIILQMELPNITFTTRSFNALTEIARLSANDSEQLFHDMLFYNPYFTEMKAELDSAVFKTETILRTIEAEQIELKPMK